MEKLFTYGTLQDPDVQQRVFHRLVSGTPDILDGYYKYDATFPDGIFPIIEPRDHSIVEGKIIDVTPDELVLIDAYETDAYRRIMVTLKSGTQAWVYTK